MAPVEWAEEKASKPQYSTGSSWRPPSMHCSLSFTFVTFLIRWPVSSAASSVYWYRPCLVCSGLAYEIYSGASPSTYVYCVVYYCVIVAPHVRSVGHVFVYLYTLDDDSERPMDYETSLLPKVFPLCIHPLWYMVASALPSGPMTHWVLIVNVDYISVL